MFSSHNERIKAKRENACMEFLQATSTNMATANHYLKQTAFDLERAVALFYDAGGEALPSDNEAEEEEEQQETTPPVEQPEYYDPISTIMKSAKEASPEDTASSSSFGGRGFSLNSSSSNSANNDDNSSPSSLKIRVTFYKDGFTAQEEEEEKKPAASSDRRRGVHSFSASSSSNIPRLPPLRTYEANRQFIEDVQNSRVPMEYRRLDSQNRPIPVSILLNDQRKHEYPVEIWKKQQQEEASSNSFGGAGQTLGGSATRSGGNTNPSPQNNPNASRFASLLALLISWWQLLVKAFSSLIHQAVPLKKHIVDAEKPTTTISLRMPNNKRDKVEFNTDHTIQDLRRYCQIELEKAPDEFELLAGFPPKAIANDANPPTLQEAGLLNSAVDVRVFSNGDDKRRN